VIPGRATILIVSVCAAAHFAVAQPKVFGVQTDGTAPRDLATDVAALVAERCAPCHSPAHPDAASEPRALRKWAGATDLAAVIETVVVPGTPDESDLYLSVELDEMPPADSASAPLTEEEKALIHAWITGGAPLPTPPAPEPTDTAVANRERPVNAAPKPSTLELIGRFHPLAVHFPIALLLAALPAALWARWRRSTVWAMCADYCTALGALGAVLASALGWCAHEAGAGALHPDLLERHEWSGFAAAFLALLALGAAVAARRGHRFGRWHLPLLGAAVAVVSAAGHFGGMLVWGEDFLPLPF
jgi:uncharacterized membrane protein/mono/diheme cytochrome c family protein